MSWNNPSTYEYTSSHVLEQWIWEFIRRSSDYKKYYLDENRTVSVLLYYHLPDFSVKKVYETWTGRRLNRWRLAEVHNPDDASPPNIRFTKRSVLSDVLYTDEDIVYTRLKVYFLDKSGDYAADQPVYIMDYRPTEDIQMSAGDVSPTMQISARSALFKLDADLPLNRQIKQITEAYKKMNSDNTWLVGASVTKTFKITKQKVALWKMYLRCLDAESSQIPRKVAASQLFPNDKQPLAKWDETLRQAKRMQKDGYLTLLDSRV